MLKYFVMAVALGCSVAQACPQINGEFAQQIDANSSVSISVNTRMENGVVSYSMDNGTTYVAADGQPHHQSANGESGSVKISCSGDTVDIDLQMDGGPAAGMQIEKTGETSIRVTGRGGLSDSQGTYIRR
ncbi:MAG: hypothetical protein ACJ763_20010 [Bdellovibrionia bacterium]